MAIVELMDEVEALDKKDLIGYIKERAELIVSNTQGDEWDDPEAWQIDAAELAHAVVRYFDSLKNENK